MEFKEYFEKEIDVILEKLELRNQQYRERFTARVLSIKGIDTIDPEAFDSWFKNWNCSHVKAKGNYFLAAINGKVNDGSLKKQEITAKPQDLDDKAARLEDLESFEKEVDDWIRMFEETKLFGAPLSRGIDKYNNIRGVFDGLGSFVYTDGTVSKKYPRLEDLSKEDRDALIVRIDVRHRGLPGHDEIVALVKGV